MVAKARSEITGIPIISFLNRSYMPKGLATIYNLIQTRGIGLLCRLIYRKWLPDIVFSHGYHNPHLCLKDYSPLQFYKNKKVFLLVRDPRDVLVSNYFYQKHRHQLFHGTPHEFLYCYPKQQADNPKRPRYGLDAIINYMNAWVSCQNIFQDIYIAYYEEFKKDTRHELSKLCNYLELPTTDTLIDQVVEYGSFENMRHLEVSRALDWHGLTPPSNMSGESGMKVRKGRVGGYNELFSQEDIEYMNKKIATELHPFFEKYVT